MDAFVKELYMTETRFYHIAPSGKMRRLSSLEEALATRKNEGYCWLDYYQPTKEDLSLLIEPLGLHPLSIEDCLDDNQIPKIEDYPTNTFVLFNTFNYMDRAFSIQEIDLFIGKNFLVTVSMPGPDGHPALGGIEHIIEHDIESARQGPSFLAHTILDEIVDHKFIVIEALDDELDRIEDVILADHAKFFPTELVRLRRETLSVRKSLFHEREILIKICRKDCVFISEQSILLYRDVYDHLTKFFELTEASRDLVTTLMEMYLSILNNQMTKASNDTNIIVRRLTLITTIFMPLTLIAGIGGMSEWSMITGPENWRTSYPIFFLIMLVLAVINYFFIKWLERKNPRD
jgi:magnesium transporter